MSKIQWTDATWSPITGCTRASPGCDNCYAALLTKRLAAMGQAKYQGLYGNGHFNGVVKTWDDELEKPLRWKKPRMIFVNSMSDTFHKDVPFEFIDKMFAVMALCPQHTFQVLTKRPERMAEVIPRIYARWNQGELHAEDHASWFGYHRTSTLPELPLKNVWLGCSAENQEQADKRIPWLLKCPAAVRFVSAEPLLEAVDLNSVWPGGMPPPGDGPYVPRIDWVIIGGESGRNARPFNLDWARSLIRQCREAGVAPFLKQIGAKPIQTVGDGWSQVPIVDPKGGREAEWPSDLQGCREFPGPVAVERGAQR